MPPPIRYPLPIVIALVLLALLFWRGAAWTRSFRSALAVRLARAVEGPPLPHSEHPQVVAGPIIRRALLLHDDVPVADRPGGPPTEAIRHRMFVDIYDVWPLQGGPEHYRVGNRKAIGWVRRVDLLPWDTRLVIRGEGGALPLTDMPDHPPRPIAIRSSLPVLEWGTDVLTVAVWDADHPWAEVERKELVRAPALPTASWGVWLSREELLALLRRTLAPAASRRESELQLRLRALLGRLRDDRPLSDTDVQAARTALPPPSLAIAAGSLDEASERLSRINEQWSAEASWGGVSFGLVPLDALP
jgi:hypothetical protein